MNNLEKLIKVCKKFFPFSKGNSKRIELRDKNKITIAIIEIYGNYALEIVLGESPIWTLKGELLENLKINYLKTLSQLIFEIKKEIILQIGDDDNSFERFISSKVKDHYHYLKIPGEIKWMSTKKEAS